MFLKQFVFKSNAEKSTEKNIPLVIDEKHLQSFYFLKNVFGTSKL